MSRYNVKRIRIWSFSGPYFPIFEPKTEIYRVSLRIQSAGEYGPEKRFRQCDAKLKLHGSTKKYRAVFKTLSNLDRKSPIIDVSQGPEYTFGMPYQT